VYRPGVVIDGHCPGELFDPLVLLGSRQLFVVVAITATLTARVGLANEDVKETDRVAVALMELLEGPN